MSCSYATTDFEAAASGHAEPCADEHARIKEYYRAVAQDFRAWSPKLNMHFGYWDWNINPMHREDMLERMNVEVLNRLDLPLTGPALLADLGCGAGATARTIAQRRVETTIDAVTVVMEQILQGAELSHAIGLRHKVKFRLADYTNTRLPAAQYDGVYALESACHARGADKRPLLRETFRLLKPGGRLVIVDAFLRTSRPLPRVIDRLYRSWCRNWVVSELAEISAIRAALADQGYTHVSIDDITWRIAPSALQIPFFATWFTARALWRARFKLDNWRIGHILASYASFLMGCWLPGFGYYVVTARKPA
jgi:cyclopropane fatty-acyl-phospholipid synthase-like methyltransferase